jgi:hypothetical protein
LASGNVIDSAEREFTHVPAEVVVEPSTISSPVMVRRCRLLRRAAALRGRRLPSAASLRVSDLPDDASAEWHEDLRELHIELAPDVHLLPNVSPRGEPEVARKMA